MKLHLNSLTAHVISLNLKRRQLTAGQKAAAAVEALPHYEAEAKKRQLSTLTQSTDKETIPERDKGQARDKAAAAVGVNPRYVSDAKKIADEAPEVFEEVREPARKLRQR